MTTLGITALSIRILCRYAEFHYAGCRVLLIVALNVVMLSVVALSVVAPLTRKHLKITNRQISLVLYLSFNLATVLGHCDRCQGTQHNDTQHTGLTRNTQRYIMLSIDDLSGDSL
jgi:hypothetical protein